jgi:hypothetical protein
MPTDTSFANVFFATATLIFGSTAAAAFSDRGFRDTRGLTSALIAFISAVLAAFWSKLSPELPTSFVEAILSLASNPWAWFGMVIGYWVFSAVITVKLIIQRDRYRTVVEQSVVPFQAALEKWVFPRNMSFEQINNCAAYLQNCSQNRVDFRIEKDDDEAEDFANNIKTAIRQGGWVVGETQYEKGLMRGLELVFEYTNETGKKIQTGQGRSLQDMLYAALNAGLVEVRGTGQGGGVAQDRIAIVVGGRLRGRHARPVNPP